MQIICDTREQNPLWTGEDVLRRKLDVGDYTTIALEGRLHIERKASDDFYSTLFTQYNHERFKREFARAQAAGTRLVIYVECPKHAFIGKRFPGGWRRNIKPATIAKVISTFEEHRGTRIIWCTDRADMREKILRQFTEEEQKLTQPEGINTTMQKNIP